MRLLSSIQKNTILTMLDSGHSAHSIASTIARLVPKSILNSRNLLEVGHLSFPLPISAILSTSSLLKKLPRVFGVTIIVCIGA
ncbi:hypothetical protein PAXRUDRAFT_802719 [Paxillus rubicundulus Ve08.2h10]|uniref:Uncharacterized protein n=1 Tax=Paxillus rubicundulus Ve08.2h10 TaxID=930991 RepID=A0A0D0DSF8_9AGAM|nr:hypothetical protein PAXRUDRAFT_802719 [Paxillus rubicundulus Ve08.2h10]